MGLGFAMGEVDSIAYMRRNARFRASGREV